MTRDGDGTRVAAAAAWRRLAGGRPTPHASSRRDRCALGSLGARSLRALGGGHCGDDSLALGVGAVASGGDGVTCDGDGTRVAAAAAWRRPAGCRPTPPASSRRDRCALGSLGARSLRAPGGGHCGDDSLALGVGAVASEVTA